MVAAVHVTPLLHRSCLAVRNSRARSWSCGACSRHKQLMPWMRRRTRGWGGRQPLYKQDLDPHVGGVFFLYRLLCDCGCWLARAEQLSCKCKQGGSYPSNLLH